MANYRRNFLAGDSYFVTVNMADRRLTLLNDHLDLLRAAFRQVWARHPFTIEAAVIRRSTFMRSGSCPMAMRISPCVGA